MDQYAVFGNPINHSLSPQIHTLFAAQTQQCLVYKKIMAPMGEFESVIQSFIQQGGKGANITVPFKEAAYALCDVASNAAQQSGAVNTLLFNDGNIEGHNTDGVGLVRDIQQNHAQSLKNKRLLVLGAGGAVRGIMPALFEASVLSIDVVNRTHEKAVELAKCFLGLGSIQAKMFNQLGDVTYDVVIQATSVRGQIDWQLPVSAFKPMTLFYDLNYQLDGMTPFLQWVSAQGYHHMSDGLGMLVEQAAESFYLWRGVHLDTDVVRQMLVIEH